MTPEEGFRHPWIKNCIKELSEKAVPVETKKARGSAQQVNHVTMVSGGLPTINDS
jgi:hypothetical protein